MTNAGITIGVVVGSFMIVACFGLIIARIARHKHRERLIMGTAFAMIKSEETRFQGIVKRVAIVAKRPSVQQIFELQDYYNSGECTSSWEKECIEYTFKNMQLLGYEVKLYKTGKDGKNTDVDLSKRYVKPCKEVKKEMKRMAKLKKKKAYNGGQIPINDLEDGVDELDNESQNGMSPDVNALYEQEMKRMEDFSSLAAPGQEQNPVEAKTKNHNHHHHHNKKANNKKGIHSNKTATSYKNNNNSSDSSSSSSSESSISSSSSDDSDSDSQDDPDHLPPPNEDRPPNVSPVKQSVQNSKDYDRMSETKRPLNISNLGSPSPKAKIASIHNSIMGNPLALSYKSNKEALAVFYEEYRQQEQRFHESIGSKDQFLAMRSNTGQFGEGSVPLHLGHRFSMGGTQQFGQKGLMGQRKASGVNPDGDQTPGQRRQSIEQAGNFTAQLKGEQSKLVPRRQFSMNPQLMMQNDLSTPKQAQLNKAKFQQQRASEQTTLMQQQMILQQLQMQQQMILQKNPQLLANSQNLSKVPQQVAPPINNFSAANDASLVIGDDISPAARSPNGMRSPQFASNANNVFPAPRVRKPSQAFSIKPKLSEPSTKDVASNNNENNGHAQSLGLNQVNSADSTEHLHHSGFLDKTSDEGALLDQSMLPLNAISQIGDHSPSNSQNPHGSQFRGLGKAKKGKKIFVRRKNQEQAKREAALQNQTGSPLQEQVFSDEENQQKPQLQQLQQPPPFTSFNVRPLTIINDDSEDDSTLVKRTRTITGPLLPGLMDDSRAVIDENMAEEDALTERMQPQNNNNISKE